MMPRSATPRVLVIDDERMMRELIKATMETAGYAVETAIDGAQGLERILTTPHPDLVICDVIMPKLDGLRVLREVRRLPATAAIPLILVTGIDNPILRSRAARYRVDGIINKPFNAQALLALVRSRIDQGRADGRDRTPLVLADDEHPPRSAAAGCEAPGVDRHCALLSCQFGEIATGASGLSKQDVAEVLNECHARLCEPVILEDGWVACVDGNQITALFESSGAGKPDHALRAVRSALVMMIVAGKLRAAIAKRYPEHKLARLAPQISVHLGAVRTVEYRSGADVKTRIVGHVGDEFDAIRAKQRRLGWSIAASDAVIRVAGQFVCTGRSQPASKSAKLPITFEVTGMDESVGGVGPLAYKVERVKSALQANDEVITAAVKEAAFATGRYFHSRTGHRLIDIDGYRLVKRLGQGAYAQVFLAHGVGGGDPLVLKVLDVPKEQHIDAMQRFIHEYALVSQISHPHVARIFNQGFTNEFAFIAMEYFPGGDLEQMIANGLSGFDAITIMLQLAGALGAIHAAGVVHRDIKPENVMMRRDGTVAIADFGIARQAGLLTDQSAAGQIVGTPYYISPEQIRGEPATQRSDLYSLGVLYYVMLTGKRPYEAPSAMGVLDQHANAPLPQLPVQHGSHQRILARLMAKWPEERFASAAELYDHAFVLRETLADEYGKSAVAA